MPCLQPFQQNTGEKGTSMFDDEKPANPRIFQIGEDISFVSAGELEERINILKAEIERLRTAINARNASKNAAESLFAKK